MNRKFKLTGPHGTFYIRQQSGDNWAVVQRLPLFRSRIRELCPSRYIAQLEAYSYAQWGC